jgi:hypothetical protein
MSHRKPARWRRAAGEVLVFVVALLAAAYLVDLIAPVRLPASGVAVGREAEQLNRRLSVNYWVGVPLWIATYCLLHTLYRRWCLWDHRRLGR